MSKHNVIIAFICCLNGVMQAQVSTKYTVIQMQEDLRSLRTQLEAKQPNLYLYSSKEFVDHTFDSLLQSITEPMTDYAFYKHISILHSVIKDGHTIILPGKEQIEQSFENNTFLPYTFKIAGDQLLVDMVCNTDGKMSRGDTIVSINNVPALELVDSLMERQIRDGYNLTYPRWILDNFFSAFYSFCYGNPETFSIGYLHDAAEVTALVNGLSMDSIQYLEHERYPERTNEKKAGDGITFFTSADNSYALLTIKDFHQVVLKKEYNQNFRKEIKACFAAIEKNNTPALIIDIRNNQGGNLGFGVYLLQHLLDTPFTIIDTYYKIDKSASDYQLKETSGSALGMQKPAKNVFAGKLFLLVNGGSFSNSGIVSACLKRNNRGIFVGEETGGNNKTISAYIAKYTLPHTGIQVEIPTRQFMLDAQIPFSGHGTIPDHIIDFNLSDFLEQKDTALQLAITLARE